MTHRSKIGVICIDCRTDELSEAARFWSGALGGPAEIDADGKYAEIGAPGGMRVLLQAVDHEPRVHLDVETDDNAAEVARLEALGARVVDRVKSWVVMEAPTGHRFCVVGPQTERFAEEAREWSR